MPYIETAPYLGPKQPERTQDGWNSSENLFFRIEKLINQRRLLPIEKWRKLYKKACKIKGITDEDTLKRIQGTHASLALEVQNGNEEADLDFLRQELSGLKLDDRSTSAFQLYRLGVVCLRKPKAGSEEIMVQWGRALFQAAFKRYQNPQFARGAIDELTLKAHQRARKRRRERRQEYRGKYRSTESRLFQNFNAPEVFGMYTPEDYRKQLDYWREQLDQLTKGEQINWGMFRKEYERLVKTAGKIRDTREYDKTGFYKRIDYKEMIRNKDSEAIIKGLAAIYATPEKEKRECEVPGFRLLMDIAFNLPPPATIYRPPQPWKAWVAFVIKEELIRKLGEVTTKPSARQADLEDMLIRVRGGVPEELRNMRTLNVEKPEVEEKLPF